MGVKRYRKKPVEVTGVLYTGENADEVKAFVGVHPGTSESRFRAGARDKSVVWNDSQDDWNPVNPGDTILRGLVGEFYPCSPDALAKTYDEVEGPA